MQQLTLDTLTRTNHEKNVRTNMPLLNGIYHDQLLMEILEITNDMGYDAEITGLFAAQDKERRLPGVSIISEIERSTEPRAIEAHILRRIFANIKLTRRGSDQPTTKGCETCMAVAYHQRGIQVGFGTRVLYCQNQMLLNAECYVTTYPDDNAYKEVNIHELFSTIRDWLKNANQYVEKEQAVLKRWRKQKINQSQLMYTPIRDKKSAIKVGDFANIL